MLDNDGIDSCVGHVAMSCRARQLMPPLPETLVLGKIYLILEAPRWSTGCPGPSRVGEGGGPSRQLVKSCLPTSTVMRKRYGVDCSRVQFFLG
jgi:hypothetical protein